MRFTLRNLTLYIVTFSLVFFACQKDDVVEEGPNLDQDMVTAIGLVDDYLIETKGRTDVDVSVTVFQYYDGQLWYRTYLDSVAVYLPVDEQTITAIASPGEYIFWYGGTGLADLDGIDFDQPSEEFLNGDSDEIFHDRLWAVQIPHNINDSTEFLKYDIVYQFDGNSGPVIRLDPKIRIKTNGVEVEVEVDPEPTN
ncbi:hypothetical protein [Ekhidna sp.]|uniref:hypothetical protein n=1 Tax=Ekhidna sp. TaxID=2608089 RepID=UPI003BAD2B21